MLCFDRGDEDGAEGGSAASPVSSFWESKKMIVDQESEEYRFLCHIYVSVGLLDLVVVYFERSPKSCCRSASLSEEQLAFQAKDGSISSCYYVTADAFNVFIIPKA